MTHRAHRRWSPSDVRKDSDGHYKRAEAVRTEERPILTTPLSKFGNQHTDGYASKKEAARAQTLDMLERAGAISQLRKQVRFELIPAQYVDGQLIELACEYIADFVYVEGGKVVVEDAKGFLTKDYRIKRKLMLFRHGIRVRET